MKFKLHADFCKHPVYGNDSQLLGNETKTMTLHHQILFSVSDFDKTGSD